MKKYVDADVIVSIFLILVSVYVFVDARSFPADSGLGPMICSVLLVIGSLFVLHAGLKKTRDFRKNATAEMVEKKRTEVKDLGVSLVSLAFCVGYLLLIPRLGFFASTTIFMISFMLYLNVRNYALILIITLGINAILYFLFITQLNVRLPKGILI